MPIIYAFFPEISNLHIEDIGHLVEEEDVRGGVLNAKGRRFVEPSYHAYMYQANLDGLHKRRVESYDVGSGDAKVV